MRNGASQDRACQFAYSPLLYNITTPLRVCSVMMAAVQSPGLFGATVHATCASVLSFCGFPLVNHFRDSCPLLTLSCSGTHINEILLFIREGVNTLAPVLAVQISYAFALSRICHICSTEGQSKAFSICSSHLLLIFHIPILSLCQRSLAPTECQQESPIWSEVKKETLV